MKTILTLIFLSLSIAAKTVDIKDYATPNDGQNDRDGFQQAVNELQAAGGGTLRISGGVWDLQGAEVRFSGYVSFKLEGTKGAVLRLANATTFPTFYVGNVNQFELRDLIFIGGTTDVDTAYILQAHYTHQVLVSGNQFYGVYANRSLMETTNVDAVYENNQFEGSGGNEAVIKGGGYNFGFRSITGRNNTFIDYGNFNGQYYSKIGRTPAWILVESEAEQPISAAYGSTFVWDGGRFDEGATVAVNLKNVRNVQIRNVTVNLSGVDAGKGIVLDNVKYGSVTSSVFGYQPNPRPVVVALNKTNVDVSKLTFGGGAYLGEADRSSQIKVGFCPDCVTQERPGRK